MAQVTVLLLMPFLLAAASVEASVSKIGARIRDLPEVAKPNEGHTATKVRVDVFAASWCPECQAFSDKMVYALSKAALGNITAVRLSTVDNLMALRHFTVDAPSVQVHWWPVPAEDGPPGGAYDCDKLAGTPRHSLSEVVYHF